MSISDNYAPDKSQGNGVTVNFSGNWKVLNSAYFRLYLENIATGALTLKALGSDYTLVFDDSGYTATMLVAPSNAFNVIRAREVAIDQTVPYKTSKGFQGEVQEDSFDKGAAIDQDQQDQIDRAMKFQVGSTITNPLLPTPVDGYGVVWDGITGLMRNTTVPMSVLEGDAEIVADNIASVIIVANNIGDLNTVAGDIADVIVVSGISSAVQNVSSISAAVVGVDANESNINAVAAELTDIGVVATNISNVNAVAGNETNIDAVAANEANIDAVAADLTNINIVATNISNVNAVGADITNVNSVATDIANVNIVANNMATITDAANNIPKANRNATTNPGVGDDTGDGYSPGSLWINVTTDAGFLCMDATLGAAIWLQITTAATSAVQISYNNATSGLSATNVQTAIDEVAAPGFITNAKLAQMANNTVKGRKTAGTGVPEDLSITQILDMVGSPVQGHILYRNGSTWVSLAPGTNGQFLQTQGAGANPQWADVVSTGRFIKRTIYTSSTSWTPDAATNTIVVRMKGAGGGGTANSGAGTYGAGGGEGGYSERLVIKAQFSTGQTVTLGAGGTAGNAGGTSSFGSFISITGGAAGGASAAEGGLGGNGGVPTSGDINITGAKGGNGGIGIGGIGGGGGPQTGPGNATVAAPANSGLGGAGSARQSGNQLGTAGAAGYCIVEEYT